MRCADACPTRMKSYSMPRYPTAAQLSPSAGGHHKAVAHPLVEWSCDQKSRSHVPVSMRPNASVDAQKFSGVSVLETRDRELWHVDPKTGGPVEQRKPNSVSEDSAGRINSSAFTSSSPPALSVPSSLASASLGAVAAAARCIMNFISCAETGSSKAGTAWSAGSNSVETTSDEARCLTTGIGGKATLSARNASQSIPSKKSCLRIASEPMLLQPSRMASFRCSSPLISEASASPGGATSARKVSARPASTMRSDTSVSDRP
mmetsp:Transcript_38920/g.94528  ORF Transcript_38920/g.94528 Transcript_38920/m.94528 type:complete len:262 (+) Transcript_38920:282-1067(+)